MSTTEEERSNEKPELFLLYNNWWCQSFIVWTTTCHYADEAHARMLSKNPFSGVSCALRDKTSSLLVSTNRRVRNRFESRHRKVRRFLNARLVSPACFSRTSYVQMDRCTRENQNRFIFGYIDYLIRRNVFDDVLCRFHQLTIRTKVSTRSFRVMHVVYVWQTLLHVPSYIAISAPRTTSLQLLPDAERGNYFWSLWKY